MPGVASAQAAGTQIVGASPEFWPDTNAAGNALSFATRWTQENIIDCTRKVIDVSGGDPNMTGLTTL